MSLIEKAAERLQALHAAGGLQDSLQDGPAPAHHEARAEQRHAAEPLPAGGRQVHIDLAALARAGMVTPDQPRSPLAEEFRVIKRPLLRNLQGRGAAPVANANLVMVSSALPGEGKSFSAINLAISIAMELDHTVLLVDADVSRPSVLQRLGLAPELGLMDVLTGGAQLGEVLLRTNVDKLSLLSAGMPQPRATELLASEAMNRLLEEMATRYADRVIVFDSPPLLMTTEARELATHMGQVLMVVEAHRSTHAAVRQALAAIDNCPLKLLMLNKASERGAGAYYGYGHAYASASEMRADAA